MSFDGGIRKARERGVVVNKITAVVLCGKDRFEKDIHNPYMAFWDIFPQKGKDFEKNLQFWADRINGKTRVQKPITVNDF